jgi:hypothetical protein
MRVIGCAIVCAIALLGGDCTGEDWPQLQKDAAHSGYTPDSPAPPYTLKWVRDVEEPMHTTSPPIVADGKVFLGTNWGNLIAFDRETGETVWRYATGAPILGTPAYDGGLVFANSMDRKCHAVAVRDGSPVWQFETGEGIWAAPVLAGGKVFVAGRDGFVYALRQQDGTLVWKAPIDGPVLATPAYADGTLFVPGGDNRVYAFQGEDGLDRWTSAPLPGAAIRDYWLVVGQGKVMATTQFVRGCHDSYRALDTAVMKPFRTAHEGKMLEQGPLLDEVARWLVAHPDERSLHLLDAATGKPGPVPPLLQVHGGGCSGPLPTVAPDGAAYAVYANVRLAASGWAFVGRLDLGTGGLDPLIKGRYWVSDKEWEWQAAPGTKLAGRSAFDVGFCVNDQSWGLCLAGDRVFAVRDPGWSTGQMAYSYIDVSTGEDGWIVNNEARDIAMRGSFGGAFHATCAPMVVSDNNIFHKTARNVLVCFEGN